MEQPRIALLFATLSLAAAPARAVDLAVRAEPAIAGPVSSPQSNLFGFGGGAALRGGVSLLPFLQLQLGVGFLGFHSSADAVTITTIGAGPRLQLPHGSYRVSPWLDVDLGYARTGDLNRFEYSIGAGVAFPIGEPRSVWIGLFARYLQVVQPTRDGYDNTDAKILIAGLSAELGSPRHAAAMADRDFDSVPDATDRCPNESGPIANQGCPVQDRDGDGVPDADDHCPRLAGPKETHGCPDQDNDGVLDLEDECPDVAGPRETKGCPSYKTIVVTKEKIELSEKIFFAYDHVEILPKSYPMLDEVAQALKDKGKIKVRIEGHTDDRGGGAYNMRLSEDRASAVRQYLVSQGIAIERMEAHGYGSTQPLESNRSPEGREKNRRVEFVILQ